MYSASLWSRRKSPRPRRLALPIWLGLPLGAGVPRKWARCGASRLVTSRAWAQTSAERCWPGGTAQSSAPAAKSPRTRNRAEIFPELLQTFFIRHTHATFCLRACQAMEAMDKRLDRMDGRLERIDDRLAPVAIKFGLFLWGCIAG